MDVGTEDRSVHSGSLLFLQVRTQRCAVRLSHVREVFRPLPLQTVPVAPPFILGLSVIRGEPVPVVDLGGVLGYPDEPHPRRFVLIRVGDRSAALAVEGVHQIVSEAALMRTELPPLLGGAGRDAVETLSALDQDFVSVLRTGHLVPKEIWGRLQAGGVPT